jgi:hypothetical protein
VAALFVTVLLFRLSVGHSADATNLLYLFPISLSAMAFGRWPGIGAGILGVALTSLWVVFDEVDVSILGWASRILPMILLGTLLGDASDRLKAAELLRAERESASLRHNQAIEINDTLVQGMAAVKWLLEAGRHEAALEVLDGTLEQGHRLVSDLMREADVGITSFRTTPDA